MKNLCIVFRNCYTSVPDSYVKLIDKFLSCGYYFPDIHLFDRNCEEEKLNEYEKEMKESDVVVIIADDVKLVKDKLSSMFGAEFYQGTKSGAGLLEKNETTVFLFSGYHTEMETDYIGEICVPYLNKKQNRRSDRIVLRAVGVKAEKIEDLFNRAKSISGNQLIYNFRSNYGEDIIEIIYDSKVPKMMSDDVLRLFMEELGDSVYTLDDTKLEERLIQILKLRGKKISVAESFTGGGIARRIVSVSGASEVYFEGLNTYNEQAKIKRLGVKEYTLKTLGAVSDETAYEMAMGLLASGDCDVSIATTGIAGPKSDRSELPVGLCYIAVGLKEKIYVYRYKFEGTRQEITETAINYALFLAYKQLKNL